MDKSLIAVILLWMLYFIIHSIFASNPVKKYFEKKLGSWYRYYRLVYVVFATFFLLAIFFYQSIMEQTYFYPRTTFSNLAGLILATWGFLIIKAAFKYYDISEFMGLAQVKGEIEEQEFLREGILNLVRHPIYTGTILLLTGFLIFSPSLINLITVFCMISYILIGIRLEEKKLLLRFGDQYRKYKVEVPALFPGFHQLRKYIS